MGTAMIHNAHAETAIAAGCFHSSRMADELLGLLDPDDLVSDPAATVYRAVAELRARHVPIDPMTVWQHLRHMSRDDVTLDTLTAWHRQGRDTERPALLYYARTVLTCAQIRRVEDAARRILLDVAAYAGGGGYVCADDLAGQALSRLNAALAIGQHGGQLISIGDSAQQLWAQIQSGAQPGIPTGYADLDSLTGGWHAGDLNLVAARPGCGKTAFALNVAERVASAGVPVFFSSMEMAHDQLTGRLLAKRSCVDGQAIRLRNVASGHLAQVAAAVEGMFDMPITIYDRAAVTLSDMRARASIWREQHPDAALLIVDYLQLMRGEERRKDQRHLEVGEISQGLKALARELGAPVIALSQLSRAIEGRAGHVPMLSDLRESGSLEQDADMVLFIHREEVYDRDTDKKGIAELIVAKQRNGPLGIVPVRFDAATTTFHSLVYRGVEGYE